MRSQPMPSAHTSRAVLTDRTILLCDRIRMLRASRIADDAISIAGGVACRRAAGAWPNLAAGFSLDPPITAPDIDRLVAWLGEIGKNARVELNDRHAPATFTLFADAGFHLKWLVSILALELHNTPGKPPDPVDIRFEVIDHSDLDTCRQLAEVLAQQFAAPGAEPDPGDIVANLIGIRHSDAIAVGAFDADRCIGGGLLDVLDEAATLWGAAVAPEYRRRGVQSALISRRLSLARERGATLAFIETNSGGPTHRNASAIGFRMAYSRALLLRPLNKSLAVPSH